MFLHTIVPPEQIFPANGGEAYEYQNLHNSIVQGVRENGGFTVRRLISTDPAMYLDPRFAPGGRLAFSEKQDG